MAIHTLDHFSDRLADLDPPHYDAIEVFDVNGHNAFSILAIERHNGAIRLLVDIPSEMT